MPTKLDKKLPGQVELNPIPKPEIEAMKAYYDSVLTKPANDAKSGWVSREEIEALLRDNESVDMIPNGIRLYYGRHNKSTQSAVGYEYLGKHTIILVATYDPNEDDPQTETSVDLLNEDAAKGKVNSVSYTSSYSGMGGDTIPLCPPRC